MSFFLLQDNDSRYDPCPLCNEIFTNPAEYTLHLKKHTNGTKCLVCGKILSSANSLDRHLLVHSGEKPFECKHCGKSFTTNGNMNRHKRKRKHLNNCVPDSPEKKPKKVDVPEEKTCEISIPVSIPLNTGKGRLHDCRHCVYGFRSLVKTGLTPKNFALISRMDCEKRKTCPFNVKDVENVQNEDHGTNVCDSCGDVCLRMSDLHRKVPNDDLYICTACDTGFICLKQFKLHELSHKVSLQNEPLNTDFKSDENKERFLQVHGLFKTEIIDSILGKKKPEKIKQTVKQEPEEKVLSLNSLVNHQNENSTHVTETSAVVSLSSKSARNVTSPLSADCASPVSNSAPAPASPDEESSMSKECSTSDNELQCKECRECFKTKKLLKIHYHQIHLQKNTFRCPQCSYVSTDKSTLTRHIRIHTGERPYMCVTCNRKFTTETNAKRHIKKKHNIFEKHKKYIVCNSSEKSTVNSGNTKCHYCRKDFGDSKLLTQHKNAPDCPGKPYICSECPMRFPTKNNCLRHMTHQHKLQRDEAREVMIVDKFVPSVESKSCNRLQNLELILDAARSDIVMNAANYADIQNVAKEENAVEESLNCADRAESYANDAQSEMKDFVVTAHSSLTEETKFTTLNIDSVCPRPSSTEVDVSYSMLRLSEELPYQPEQEEPLDLSIRPIDLSTKITKSEESKVEIIHTVTSEIAYKTPPPAHTPVVSRSSSHLNLLNFFNMSPYAQSQTSQLGSRPFSPSIQTYRPQTMTVSSVPEFQKPAKNISQDTTALLNDTADSCDSERELFIVEDTTSTVFSNDKPVAHVSPLKQQHASDSEINDLASVSSVIDTANSQDISKYLNPSTFNKANTTKAELSTVNHVAKSSVCGNSADCNKKFPCGQCNKSFDTSSALKRHMVIHTGVKKHKCSTCGKPFGTKSNCKRHELTHLPKNSHKHRSSTVESQNTSDISNNDYLDFSNYSGATRQSKNLEQNAELSQNSLSHSFDENPASSILATFSHLLSESFPSMQSLECKFCLNSYRSKKDLIYHMKELHPLEYMGEISSVSH